MRKFFGSSLAGLYVSLPTIVAELAEDLVFDDRGFKIWHDRGSRVYLVMSHKNPLDSDTIDGLVRTKTNQIRLREIAWSALRFVEIDRVPSSIGEKCWRGTKEEMDQMVERIRREKIKVRDNFAPDVDL